MRIPHFYLTFTSALVATALSISSVDTNGEPIGADLQRRESETVKKIWNLENSQIALNYAGVFAAIAGGIAAIITATSSGSSGCTITTKYVQVEERSVDDEPAMFNHSAIYNLTSISNYLSDSGFEVDYNAWAVNKTGVMYQGTLSNSENTVKKLAITDSGVEFNVQSIATGNTTAALEARTTTLKKDEVYVRYHATGKCYTTHTKSEVAAGIVKALKQISNNNWYASCWALRFGSGSWHGHLKILGVYADGDVSEAGWERTCNTD